MKKWICGLLICLCLLFPVYLFADDTNEEVNNNAEVVETVQEDSSILSITTKQGFLRTWETKETHQLTMFEIMKTDVEKVPSWPKWVKAIYAGWSLDAGFAYDKMNNVVENGALAVARHLGTLADYLPLEFPLFNKIDIYIYPYAKYINDLFGSFETENASGLSYFRFEIKL